MSRRGRVLVVDDELLVRTVLRDRLEDEGFVVEEACHGEEAYGKLGAEGEWDLILTDMDMPVCTGLELLERLAASSVELPPILVLSGNEDIAVVLQALERGAEQYIRKDADLGKTVMPAIERCLEKRRLQRENRRLVADLERRNEELSAIVDTMAEIGIALSAETNLELLLEIILGHARSYTNADAGTLYLRDGDELVFKVVQNETLGIQLGGAGGDAIPFKPVRVDPRNVSGWVALKGETVRIDDVYDTDLFDFTGPRDFDAASGYRSRSMLVVPLKDHHGRVVGVLQLLNSTAGSARSVVPFSARHAQLAEALASQAAVAVTNLILQQETVALKNYNVAILESLSNGVLTVDETGAVQSWNGAALRILGREAPEPGEAAESFLGEENRWLVDAARQVRRERRPRSALDAELALPGGGRVPVNVAVVPLEEDGRLRGSIVVCEDITTEKRIRSTLARYMPPDVAERLLEEESALLGGTLQPATVLFSDIRGFTSLTETLGARGSVDLLNEYFGRMTDSVFTHRGSLDKFIGDALLAVFGVPFPAEDDADRALAAVRDMMAGLAALNRDRSSRWEAPLRVGVGIHSDEVVSGNIGSPRRMDFTIVGDGVNLASRLESANKYYGTTVLLSGRTREAFTETPSLRFVDRLCVMGKRQAVEVWELVEARPDGEEVESILAAASRHAEAVEAYRERRWDEAERLFDELARALPADRVPALYRERCQALRQEPPGPEWDGTWRLDRK